MSIADDDVYLLAKGTSMMMVLAIEVRMWTLRGVVKLPERHLSFMRYFLASGISKNLKTTGTLPLFNFSLVVAIALGVIYAMFFILY